MEKLLNWRFVAAVFALALATTNAWWFYRFVIDPGLTATYGQVVSDDEHVALAQSLAIIAESAKPNATRSTILAAAHRAANEPFEFEKDGYVWVGRVGLKFDEHGRLLEVSRAWEY